MLKKKTRTILLMSALSIAVMLICFLWAGTVKVKGSECRHEVYCDDTTCIICGKEDLQEEEISKVVHPFSYCYDLSTCGVCEESIPEGSAEDVRHNFEERAKYYLEGDRHRVECFCGEEFEIQMHIVKCTQDDLCFLCGGAATSMEKIVRHEGGMLFQDENYHWRECTVCKQIIMPKFEHYTDCTDPDGPCGLCDRPHDECNFIEEKIGLHRLIHEILGEGEERHHEATCLACGKIENHEGIDYSDFGSDDFHVEICAECGYKNDEFHDYKNGVCALCGHKQQSDPDVPITGDESHTVAWILLMIGAGLIFAGCMVYYRKKKAIK